MSLYLRLYTNFFSHRKTLRLRQAIGDAAFWVPPRLWAYAVEHQSDGNFGKFSDQEIADAIGYPGEAAQLIEAMTSAGFLDRRRRIKNWAEHNAYHATFTKRAKRAAECRWDRERSGGKKQETNTEIKRQDNDKTRNEQACPSNASSMLGSCTAAQAVPASDDDVWLEELKANKAYCGIDVETEYAKMLRWCKENNEQPTRRRFINWLNRVDKPLTAEARSEPPRQRVSIWNIQTQIDTLKEAIRIHQANPSYVSHLPQLVTPEIQADYDEKRAKLARLREEICNAETSG